MLVTEFLIVLLIVFATLAATYRATPEQQAVHKRFDEIRSMRPDHLAEDEFNRLLKQRESGRFAWLEAALRNGNAATKLHALLLQANSTKTIGTLLALCAALAAATLFVTALITNSYIAASAAATAAAYMPIALLSFRRKRRIAAFNTALPEAIDMMARSLRAGHSMTAAIGVLAEHAPAPAGPEFAEVFRKQNFGVALRDALLQLTERVPSQDLRVVVTGILVQKDTGGNLAEILDRTVFVIRERLRIQGEIRTHTAQGRMTGWILCALPVVMLVLINLVNPGYSHVLFAEPFGRKLLYIGIILLAVGSFTIRRIVNGIEV